MDASRVAAGAAAVFGIWALTMLFRDKVPEGDTLWFFAGAFIVGGAVYSVGYLAGLAIFGR